MKINKFIILSIVFIAIAACISFFDDFFRDYLDDSIVILIFYIFGIIGIVSVLVALRHHKRESNKFSIYSVSLVTLIVATTLFLIIMPPCQCGSRRKARDAVIKSDMHQLRLVAEDYYNNNDSYMGFEKDLTAIEIREDIIEMKGANLVISISPDGKQYCAEVLLNKKEWFCIDDTLIAKEYSDNPKCSSDYFSCEDETADWQTYRNEECGFEIDYPKDFVIEETGSGPLFLSSEDVASRKEPDPHFHSYTMFIYIYKQRPEESLEDHIKRGYNLEEFKEFKITPEESNWGVDWIKKTSIGENIQAYFVHEWAQARAFCHYYVRNNGCTISLDGSDPPCLEDDISNQMLSTFRFLEELKEIGPTVVWDCMGTEGCLEKWHGCENLDCIFSIMEQYGAPLDAINFTKLLSERGYLNKFQEMGKIDLGTVVFPNRANTNEAYYLLNGSPILVSTEISQDEEKELTVEMKKDPLYSEMENKYPDIWFWGFAPQFIKKKTLPNSNEEFIFEYKFVNGCRICDTEYTAKIGFDFDSNGKFLEMVFLQIVRGNIGS